MPIHSSSKNNASLNHAAIGDAASLVDPFFGKGIGITMMSGYISGEILQQVLQQKNELKRLCGKN